MGTITKDTMLMLMLCCIEGRAGKTLREVELKTPFSHLGRDEKRQAEMQNEKVELQGGKDRKSCVVMESKGGIDGTLKICPD